MPKLDNVKGVFGIHSGQISLQESGQIPLQFTCKNIKKTEHMFIVTYSPHPSPTVALVRTDLRVCVPYTGMHSITSSGQYEHCCNEAQGGVNCNAICPDSCNAFHPLRMTDNPFVQSIFRGIWVNMPPSKEAGEGFTTQKGPSV